MEIFWLLLLLLIILFWAMRVVARGGLGFDAGVTDYEERFAQLEQELRELQQLVERHVAARDADDPPAEDASTDRADEAAEEA